MSAADIVDALAVRHAKDVFVPECKMGGEYLLAYMRERGSPARGARRLDALAIRPTWTKHVVVGYEVKVSRADFVADKKWREYLPPCSHFWFVTPFDLLHGEEVPDPAGLLEVGPPKLGPRQPWEREPGPTWRVAKRAKKMDVDERALLDVLRYVAFWRLPKQTRSRA